MIDTYLKSRNIAVLEELRSFVTNMIGPVHGQAEIEAVAEIVAQPAAGDPAYWYACVRAPFPIMPYGDVEACSEQDGVDVLGVWS